MSDRLRILCGGMRIPALDPSDRGLAYGDGLFETLRVHAGVPAMWDAHWQRLALGAARLGIPLQDESALRREVDEFAAGAAAAALKLVLTRGAGTRGYAPPREAKPTVLLSLHSLPAPCEGLALRWCRLRLGVQPALAGIKHLNRLEQVLARAEWDDPGIDDGVLCDQDGRVVGTTAMNLFARIDGRWKTPSVDRCGIAGTLRGWVLGTGFAEEADLHAEALETAEAIFACNALRGILPVRKLDAREYRARPEVDALRRQLGDAHPAYAPDLHGS